MSQQSPANGRPASSSIPDPHLATLDDDRFLIGQIAKLTNRPEAEVRERWMAELRSPGTTVRKALVDWGLPFHVWSDRLNEFYERTDAFLFETLTWNLCGTKQRMRHWIAELLVRLHPDGARVLCYGDGMGFDSAYLARTGHEVVYYEVSERCHAFAEALFAREQTAVTAIRALDGIAAESFDAVICLDVLEHVPDPPSLVERMTRYIRSGGHLIVSAPFFYLAPSTGTHLRSNLRYSGEWHQLYGAYNLRPVDGEPFWNPLVLCKLDSSTQRRTQPMRLKIGGWILSFARWWHVPHVFVSKRMLARSDRPRLAARADRLELTDG